MIRMDRAASRQLDQIIAAVNNVPAGSIIRVVAYSF